jgi:hypothetical protein
MTNDILSRRQRQALAEAAELIEQGNNATFPGVSERLHTQAELVLRKVNLTLADLDRA